jgi:assimilatory nitrate reductase electron transfer subunit
MSRKNTPREKTICFCYNVTEATIVEAIKNGCTSLMDVRRTTDASTGCAGCSEEIKKLLRKFASQKPAGPDEPGGSQNTGS